MEITMTHLRFIKLLQMKFKNISRGIEEYDPLKVICAIRVKVEELICNNLSGNQGKEQYIRIHTTVKKLNYAVENEVDVHEVYFLLRPLYNDGLHMDDNDFAAKKTKFKVYV